MCDICNKARESASYGSLLSKMFQEDQDRMEFSKEMAKELSSVSRSLYSSMSWPVKLPYPMFEARAAYAVPNNYFQNISIGDERLGNSFAHGAMRSLFFAGDRLVVFSKTVNFHAGGREFFTSFLLLHLEKGEYAVENAPGETKLSAQLEKPMANLVTGKVERKRIAFAFVHQKVQDRIVSKEQVLTSARFKSVYAKYGGAQMKAGSMDIEGYAITVPHFAPHPYLLQLHGEFGYASPRDFQEHVGDYLKAHLG